MFTVGGLLGGAAIGATIRQRAISHVLDGTYLSLIKKTAQITHNNRSKPETKYLPRGPMLWSMWKDVTVQDPPMYVGNKISKSL